MPPTESDMAQKKVALFNHVECDWHKSISRDASFADAFGGKAEVVPFGNGVVFVSIGKTTASHLCESLRQPHNAVS